MLRICVSTTAKYATVVLSPWARAKLQIIFTTGTVLVCGFLWSEVYELYLL